MSGFVHEEGGGQAYDWHGARVVIKASGADTLNQLAVIDSTYPAGLSVPSHVHSGEDEMFYVLAGELAGFCDDVNWTATAGSFVFVPRDRPHGFVVTSQEAARAVVIVGPPNLDRQIASSGTPVPDSSPDP
jgi:quercetin dioxygenase-like cupin family protein